ncbi:uncharacterized protein [Nicotiana sylvestris]|uniref:uncharacterized protein n=1 Tax=Nicotiana sylvestris TaxID=4096 RepID=UPI00388C6A20
MSIKLVVGGFTVNVVSVYAPQVGLDHEVKRQFWEDLEKVVHSILHFEKLFIGGDFNGHIEANARGYDGVHGGYGFGVRNDECTSLLDFANAFDLVIATSSFSKREEHLVIPSENLTTQHRLLVIDLEIKRSRRKRVVCRQPGIKLGNLTKDKAQEFGEILLAIRAWRSRGYTTGIWTTTSYCIREAAKDILWATKGYSRGHKGD